MQPRSEAPVSQLDRAELVFEALERDGYLTLKQIVTRTGIPRSSAHRLLERMVKNRWLLRVGECYELGVRLFELGTEGVRNHWFHRIAVPHLEELQRRTRLVVHLAYLDGGDVVYWDKLASGFGTRVPTRIGGHQPAHRTALGKALLAAEPDDYLQGPAFDTLTPATPATITTREKLSSEVARVRDRGVAHDHSEAVPNVGCLAATVDAGHASTSDGHTTTAAISICGPLEALDSRLHTAVREAATRISRAARINPMTD